LPRRLARIAQSSNAQPKRRAPRRHQLPVRDVQRLTEDAVCVTFDVPPELRDEFQFAQGQHLTVIGRQGDEELRRSYSICAPAGKDPLRIAIKRIPDGRFSTWATTELRAGDVLDVMTPTGHFRTNVNPANARHYGAIAAGSGITPVLSNVATILEVERRSRVTLLYANRSLDTAMFVDELEALRERYPGRFTMHHCLSRESRSLGQLTGRLTREAMAALWRDAVAVDQIDEWLLCGPPELVTAASETLVEAGAPPRSLHRELFVADEAEEATPLDLDRDVDSAVTVILGGRRTDLTVRSSGPSILDAVLPLRADAPYACRDGVCATCRAMVIEGEVRMQRSSGLDPDEVVAGYVLACQAHPVSERVVLDFDA